MYLLCLAAIFAGIGGHMLDRAYYFTLEGERSTMTIHDVVRADDYGFCGKNAAIGLSLVSVDTKQRCITSWPTCTWTSTSRKKAASHKNETVAVWFVGDDSACMEATTANNWMSGGWTMCAIAICLCVLAIFQIDVE